MLFKRKINDSFQTILPTFRVLEEDRKGWLDGNGDQGAIPSGSGWEPDFFGKVGQVSKTFNHFKPRSLSLLRRKVQLKFLSLKFKFKGTPLKKKIVQFSAEFLSNLKKANILILKELFSKEQF
jgi:hypothetical protein